RIAVEHRQAAGGRGRTRARGDERGDRLLGEAGVAPRGYHLVGPGPHPQTQGGVGGRGLRPQQGVRRGGILDEVRIHRIELDVAHRWSPSEGVVGLPTNDTTGNRTTGRVRPLTLTPFGPILGRTRILGGDNGAGTQRKGGSDEPAQRTWT